MHSDLEELNRLYSSFYSSSVLLNKLLKEHGYVSPNGSMSVFAPEQRPIQSLPEDPNAYNTIRDEFALHAGQEIFKRLVYATIDLSKANIKDGDELLISVVWINSDGNVKSSTNDKTNAVHLATAKFVIQKVGWQVDFPESFLLIHRMDEDNLRADYPLSPSNFKPTAGASMLWTYYNPHRTAARIKRNYWLVAKKNRGQLKEYGFVKFLHWLEPSFGVNVSFNDFRTDRDIEFGAGPIIGFFRNQIFATVGYNLSVNGESPFYTGIGFSFSKVYDRIKENAAK